MDEKKDKGLQGNEKIEEAILALQQEPTEELLAHALTVVRTCHAPAGGADLRWEKMVVGLHRI